MSETHLYKETQHFRNPFVFILLSGLLALSIWGLIQQVFWKIPFGNNPGPDILLILFPMFPILFLLFFIFLKQTIVVNSTIIEVSISLFGKRRIQWANIEKAYIRTYKPIMEYGGWGIRYGFRKQGTAYNACGGNIGLQLELKNGQRVLVGTKKATELKDFLQSEGLLTEK